jgi:diaminopropionate ammonia-lyase
MARESTVGRIVNPAYAPGAVAPPSDVALAFHRALPGYAPTPLHELGDVVVKDETLRLGLPAFKVLGASWAAECGVTADTRTLVAASAGNHGRAVARIAALRGLGCRIFLPERVAPARRDAIVAEGAEVVIEGDYEHAVARAAAARREPGVLEVTDVGASRSAHDVIDGYATLFDEIDVEVDVVLVPVGVGALAAAAARWASAHGVRAVGVEPETAACLTASLAAGEPTRIPTPGTAMAGMDCAEVSIAAWPTLSRGIAETVTVADAALPAATAELAAAGIMAGECGAAVLAGYRALRPAGRALLVVTEGRTA